MPLAGVIILLLLLWLNGIFYGFSAAVHNLSGSEVEKRAQEGDKKSTYLLSLMNSPMTFVNAIPLIVMASGVSFGAFIVPWVTKTFHPYIKHLAAVILVLALVVILLASLGILTFRRIGTYHRRNMPTAIWELWDFLPGSYILLPCALPLSPSWRHAPSEWPLTRQRSL